MRRCVILAAAITGLSACAPHFDNLRVHAIQRQTPEVGIPPDHRAGEPDWQGVFVELRSDQPLRAFIARHSFVYSMAASLCEGVDTPIATLRRWNRVSATSAWDAAGGLGNTILTSEPAWSHRYWLGLDMVTRGSVGRNLTRNPASEFVDHDLRTGTRGVCIHGSGYGWLRGEWFTNVVYIPAETLREVANQPPPDQPSAPTSPRR